MLQKEPLFPSAAASRVNLRLLANGAAIEQGLSRLIAEARRSISLTMYIFSNDEGGRQVLAALTAAASRGLDVRVVVDAFGSVLTPDSFFAPLRLAGGQLHRFNGRWHPRYLVRNHQKFLIADGSTAVTGGFNFASHYFGDGVETGWRETGIWLRGAPVEELQRYFDGFWSALAQHPTSLPHGVELWRRASAPGMTASPQVAWLGSGPGIGRNAYRRALKKDLSRGSQLTLMMGYFVPTVSLRRMIGKIARRGSVRIVLPRMTDVPISRYAAWFTFGRLLRDGCEIYEYLPRPLHAKLFVIDDVVYTGSANLDIRSLQVNYELSLRIRDAALAAEVRQLIQADIERSMRITKQAYDASSLYHRLLRRAAYTMLRRFDYFVSRKLAE